MSNENKLLLARYSLLHPSQGPDAFNPRSEAYVVQMMRTAGY